jgi:hypothetical protein
MHLILFVVGGTSLNTEAVREVAFDASLSQLTMQSKNAHPNPICNFVPSQRSQTKLAVAQNYGPSEPHDAMVAAKNKIEQGKEVLFRNLDVSFAFTCSSTQMAPFQSSLARR